MKIKEEKKNIQIKLKISLKLKKKLERINRIEIQRQQ